MVMVEWLLLSEKFVFKMKTGLALAARHARICESKPCVARKNVLKDSQCESLIQNISCFKIDTLS